MFGFPFGVESYDDAFIFVHSHLLFPHRGIPHDGSLAWQGVIEPHSQSRNAVIGDGMVQHGLLMNERMGWHGWFS